MRSEHSPRRDVLRFAREVLFFGAMVTACSKHAPAGGGVAPAGGGVAPAGGTVAASVAWSRTAVAPSATSRHGAAATAAPSTFDPRASPVEPQTELTWTYAETPIGRMNAVVVLPARTAEERFPVLLTLHGMGEARKGPDKGARGWIDDYGLYRAIERLRHPPLTGADLEGFADEARLAKLNAALAAHPYRGLIIVNSYTPDMLRGDEPFSKIAPLAKFVTEELLARARRETPAIGTPQSTGIDGISLGGRAALAIGLRNPEAFAAVSGLQPAFDLDNAGPVAVRAAQAHQKNPALSFRLLTSDGDYFLASTKAISAAMKQAGVPHTLVIVPGPHDYPFNRGPAVYEMLLHHDRVLRGLPPI